MKEAKHCLHGIPLTGHSSKEVIAGMKSRSEIIGVRARGASHYKGQHKETLGAVALSCVLTGGDCTALHSTYNHHGTVLENVNFIVCRLQKSFRELI